MTRRNTPRISFIGFGEAGQAIASGLREEGVADIAAWDILFPKPEGEKLKAAGTEAGVRLANSAADAVVNSDIIISAVTAASSLEAARSVEPHLAGNPYYLDINSVSPGRKLATEKLLAGKARYVDIAVIAPIHPKRHQTPLLVAGPYADAIAPLLDELEMKFKVASPETGKAAAIKMIRSVMIKGMEALMVDFTLAAQQAGVMPAVLESLKASYPGMDWESIAKVMMSRVRQHGIRRAAEMREASRMIEELGLDGSLAGAIADRHESFARANGAADKAP